VSDEVEEKARMMLVAEALDRDAGMHGILKREMLHGQQALYWYWRRLTVEGNLLSPTSFIFQE
jgi:hypothetical protein